MKKEHTLYIKLNAYKNASMLGDSIKENLTDYHQNEKRFEFKIIT